jgi:hypothetical protein
LAATGVGKRGRQPFQRSKSRRRYSSVRKFVESPMSPAVEAQARTSGLGRRASHGFPT